MTVFAACVIGIFGLLVIVSLPCGVVAYFRHQLSDYHLVAEPIEKATGCKVSAE